MVNPHRGEVVVTLNGVPHVARLTLGALAELEHELGSDSMIALIERFETGRFSSRDVLAVVVAGLRGGGWQGGAADLLTVDLAGGVDAAAVAAATLLTRAFRGGAER